MSKKIQKKKATKLKSNIFFKGPGSHFSSGPIGGPIKSEDTCKNSLFLKTLSFSYSRAVWFCRGPRKLKAPFQIVSDAIFLFFFFIY